MKIKKLIIILFIGIILSGLMTGLFIQVGEMEAIPGRIDQNQIQTAESHAAASISKGTILLLLSVGVIGALGVSRQKKDSGSNSGRSPAERADQHVKVNEDRKKSMTRNS